MSEMIISMDYTASRLDFFKEQKKLHEQKLHWWKNQKPYKQYGPNTIHQRCSDHGAAIAYYEDAINALAYIQQLEAANAELLTKVKQLETKCHQLERERDALVEAIRDEGVVFFSNARMPCRYCDAEEKYTGERCRNCHNERFFGGFEWRGVKEE